MNELMIHGTIAAMVGPLTKTIVDILKPRLDLHDRRTLIVAAVLAFVFTLSGFLWQYNAWPLTPKMIGWVLMTTAAAWVVAVGQTVVHEAVRGQT